jgi:2-hydroxy-3-keto-5-methylthiopentenyl-1-phosphate phosphatase
MKLTDKQCDEILKEAIEEGVKAVDALQVVPMVVVGGGKEYFVEVGVCGFAWVNVQPGNGSFAKWLKKHNLARSSSSGGVNIWISSFGQSLQKKETYADAMADTFNKYGIRAYSQSRLD